MTLGRQVRAASRAVLFALVCLWTAPGPASAQLGSLIVNIGSPASGSTVSGTIQVSASVTVIGGLTVQGVRFTVDGANLGAEDTSAPYSVSWNTATVSNGSHTLRAIARDLVGAQWTSDPVTVTAFNDKTPPTVTITAPANGSTVSRTITITANASDNVGVVGVQFRLDGANLGGEDTSSPYSVSWNTTAAANGSHSLTAIARDAAGNRTTSAVVSVTAFNDTSPPVVSITSPANGATVSGTIPVTASASDNVSVVGVQFLLDGAALGAEDTTGPYSVSWNTTTAINGSHTLMARARDKAGNTTTSGGVTVTVANDTTRPSVSIDQAVGQPDPTSTAPVNFTVVFSEPVSDFTGADVTIGGTGGGVKTVTVTGGPHTYNVAVNGMTDGTLIATIAAGVARDAAGNSNTASTSTDNTVTFTSDTGPFRVEETNAAVSYVGSWTLYDGAPGGWSGGAVALSLASSVGERATLSFSGTGVRWIGYKGPQAGIANVYVDGVLVVTVDLYASTGIVQAVPFTIAGLASGPHTLAIENAGAKNQSSSEYAVVVDAFDVTTGIASDTTVPTVAITAPGAGSTVSGSATVSAEAADDTGVVGVQFLLDGATLGVEATTAPYFVIWNTTTTSSGPHILTARARDAAGNVTISQEVPVTVSHGPTVQRFEETAGTATSEWFLIDEAQAGVPLSGGQAGASNVAGSTGTFTFTGTGIALIALRCEVCGPARVSLDGGAPEIVDTYAPAPRRTEAVYTRTDLAPGRHTLVIEVLSEGQWVIVDAFDVTN